MVDRFNIHGRGTGSCAQRNGFFRAPKGTYRLGFKLLLIFEQLRICLEFNFLIYLF
jgi:hypothetical protein